MSKEQYYLKLLEKQKEFREKDKKCINKLLKENEELKDLVKRQICQAECYRYKQLLAEQAKNKKLVEIINSIVKYCAKTDTIEWFDYDNIEAIADEVNNAK